MKRDPPGLLDVTRHDEPVPEEVKRMLAEAKPITVTFDEEPIAIGPATGAAHIALVLGRWADVSAGPICGARGKRLRVLPVRPALLKDVRAGRYEFAAGVCKDCVRAARERTGA